MSSVKNDSREIKEPHSSARRRRAATHQNTRHSHRIPTDLIDGLDHTSPYIFHHEGPFDAATPARNHYARYSPLDAVKHSNEEALRATPIDKIKDSLHGHRPLDGVAYYPPGSTDQTGQYYNYEEGPNMMDEHGRFRRLPGTKLTDEDFENDPFTNALTVKSFARKTGDLRHRGLSYKEPRWVRRSRSKSLI